jgi:hypothetical protein
MNGLPSDHVQVRHGATCPDNYGPCTTCYNRFVRWRQRWHLGPDHGSTGRRSRWRGADNRYLRPCVCTSMEPAPRATENNTWAGRETGLRARFVDADGLPVQLGLTPGEAHDDRLCPELLTGLQPVLQRSSSVGVSPPATTNSQPTTLPSSSWQLSASGCMLMSPHVAKRNVRPHTGTQINSLGKSIHLACVGVASSTLPPFATHLLK